MTTVAYNHSDKQIACDSRETAGGYIRSDSLNKSFYIGAELYFCVGTISDLEAFKNAKKVRGEKLDPCLDVCAIVVKNGRVYKCAYCEYIGYWEVELNFSDAIGSGADYAIAAMDFDTNAKGAIQYAMSRDSRTGGKVRVFDLTTMRFIEE